MERRKDFEIMSKTSNGKAKRQLWVQRVVLLLYLVAMMALGYHSLSFGVWQYRNPKANAMTLYSHYGDVMTWKKLPEFQ